MLKRHIKIKFIDFWPEFKPEESIFYQVLAEKYDVELSDDAEYIFYSVFGDSILYEADGKAIKICYIGENEHPNFNICDYAMAYDHLVFDDRYFRLPDYYISDRYRRETELMECKHIGISDYSSLGKTSFCSFVVSNARASKERKQMFELLNKYKRVDSGGRYLNNIGGPVSDKLEFESAHKFSICFDNCKCRGYSTEKIVEAFAAQTIPIYWGDPDVDKVFNKNAFINVFDYPTLDDVVAKVREIDQDDNLFLSMLKEPALGDTRFTYEQTRERLSSWLCHIIDMPIEEAKRVGDGFWHGEYYWRQRNYKAAYQSPAKELFRRIRRTIGV